jgi:glycosyltransferase involved in cell wall biosynthesis
VRVATYYPWIYLKGGIERTIIELANRSRHDWTVFTGHYQPAETFPEFENIDVRRIGNLSVQRDAGSVGRACLDLISRQYDWTGFDALLIHCDGIGNLVALRSQGAPIVCLCHTPLKIAYDPVGRDRWRRFSRPGLGTRAAVSLFKAVDRFTWRRYQHVFCVSAEVRRRLITAGVVRRDQTEVLHTGVDLDRFTASSTFEPFFLVPGRIMWSKNVELAIQAFASFHANGGRRFRLVVAGAVDAKSAPYLRMLRQLGGDSIDFVIDPTDADLASLYARAHAVLFTAPNEDWGLVPLEAMASGKPVIAVRRGGPCESIIDEGTGLLCDDTPQAFAEAMRRLVDDRSLHIRCASQARARAEQFGWGSLVDRIDGYLEDAVAGKERAVDVVVPEATSVPPQLGGAPPASSER